MGPHGILAGWRNKSEQAGVGNTTNVSVPTNIDSTQTYSKFNVASSGYYTCASKISDKLCCWGSNEFLQLDQGLVGSQNSPALTENNFN